MTWKTGDADEFLEDIMNEHVCEWNFCAMDEWAWCECGKTLNFQKIESCLNATEKSGALKEALIIALHLLGHADFKNGNTGPNGIIDEGEVHACRLMDKIQLLVPRLYAAILEGKDET